MKRILRFVLLVLLALLLLTAGVVTWALNDEAFLRRQLEVRVSKMLGRELTLEHLEFDLGRQTDIALRGVKVANPPWATASEMLTVEHLETTIDLSGFPGDGIVIDGLEISGATLNLEKDQSGRANWSGVFEADHDAGAQESGIVPWRHLRLSDFELTHLSPDRQVALEFRVDDMSAAWSEGDRVTVTGHGIVGGYDLAVDGQLEPLGALLSGGRLSHRLGVEIGENRLVSQGTVDDVMTGAGADIEARISGPDIAWLLEQAALPGFSQGAFDAQLDLEVSGGRALSLDLDGDLGTLQARAAGELDRLVDPSSLALQFELSGPDLRSLAETFGIDDLPRTEYTVRGQFEHADGVTQIHHLDADLGPDRLSLSGTAGAWPKLAGTALNVSASGPDLSRWGSAMRFEHWKAVPFALQGRFFETGGHVGFSGTRVSVGEARLEIDGALGDLPEFIGGRLEFDLTVPRPGEALELEPAGFPAAPFHLSGSLARRETSVLVNALAVDLAGNTANATGTLAIESFRPGAGWTAWREVLSGSRLSGRLELPSLGAFAALFGEANLPADPLTTSFEAGLESRSLSLGASGGKLGPADFAFEAGFALAPGLRLQTATFSAQSPDFRHFFDHEALEGLPVAFRLAAEIERGENLERLRSLSLTLGDSELEVEGDVALGEGSESATLEARLHVPDIEELRPFGERFTEKPLVLPAGSLSLSTSLSGNRERVELNDISGRFGKTDVSGHLEIALAGRPEFTGTLHTPALDLAWLQAGKADEPAPAPAPPAGSVPKPVFSDAPLPYLNIDPLLVDLSLRADSVDLALTRLGVVDISLKLSEDELVLNVNDLEAPGGGRLTAAWLLRRSGDSVAMDLQGQAEGMRLGLAAAKGQDLSSYPPWDIFVDLKAKGSTIHQLAATADGQIGVILGQGRMLNSRLELLFSDLISELFSALNPFVKRHDYTDLDCAVARITVTSGVAQVDPLILQTREIAAESSGTIDLDSEKLNLTFNTRPRRGIGISPGMVINPFVKLGGTLARPAMTFDASGAAVSGGAAVATAGLSLVGKSLYDRFRGGRDACGAVASEMRKMYDGDGSG